MQAVKVGDLYLSVNAVECADHRCRMRIEIRSVRAVLLSIDRTVELHGADCRSMEESAFDIVCSLVASLRPAVVALAPRQS